MHWLSGVVTVWIAFPLYQILWGSLSSVKAMPNDVLYFILFSSINQVRRWSREVRPM